MVRYSDLLVRDGIGDDAKAVLRAIIDELAEDRRSRLAMPPRRVGLTSPSGKNARWGFLFCEQRSDIALGAVSFALLEWGTPVALEELCARSATTVDGMLDRCFGGGSVPGGAGVLARSNIEARRMVPI